MKVLKNPVILVDGSSYFFRAFHALPPLMNSKGQPTGATYGVVNMLRRLLKDFSPEHFVVVFDAKGKTFREEIYPEYKAHRPPMPNDLSCQFEPMINLIKAMGLPVVMIEGIEADDIIGTLALEAERQGHDILISTGDKDFAQLVNERITLLNTMSNQYLDIKGVEEKFGIPPHQIVDYLALIGDTVDNIPGVNKCGPKTAVKWLQQYHSLDNLMANAHEISGKIGESLRSCLSNLPLCKRLVTIKTDIDFGKHLDSFKMKEPDLDSLLEQVKTLEFKGWTKELLEGKFFLKPTSALSTPMPEKPAVGRRECEATLIQDLQAWQTFLSQLIQSKTFSFYIQTSQLDKVAPEIVGLSLAIKSDQAFYLSFNAADSVDKRDVGIPLSQVIQDLKPLLENPEISIIGHDLKSMYCMLRNLGVRPKGLHNDVMLESYVLNSSAHRHDLETLSLKYLGHHPVSLETLLKIAGKSKRVSDLTVEDRMKCAAEQVSLALQLHEALFPQLSEGQRYVFTHIEMPLVCVLGEMEREGVLIDESTLKKQGEVLKARIQALEEESIRLVGRPFNLQSPLQLQTILFEEQKLPTIVKTPKGQPSTSEAALQELAYTYRLPALILEHRRLCKLMSTYIEALPKCIHPQTHRVHTSFNQAVAATGRLSSSDPNLQNIPIRSEEGRAIRRAFIAGPDQLLLSADYSQIELRLMAHLSQDPRLLEAFTLGLDIHTATAAEILGLELDQVDSEQRRRAKAVNFGLIYGMSPFGLAKQLGIERREAELYVNRYFARYPGVLDYMERTRIFARERGYVETLFGRRLYLPEINVQNVPRRNAAERMAINAPLQGTAADLIKLAMLAMSEVADVKMVLQVHDELVFEVKADRVEQMKKVVKQKMENVMKLDVPLIVSVGVGKDWEGAH